MASKTGSEIGKTNHKVIHFISSIQISSIKAVTTKVC